MWFVACCIESENKRKQTKGQVNSCNRRLIREQKERKQEPKKQRKNGRWDLWRFLL